MDCQKVGNLISKIRKEKGFTQKELAIKLGVTDRAISKWERGMGCPDVSLLESLSTILDISILELLKGTKLNNEDIVSNEKIMDSINYSKEQIQYKFKKYFNFFTLCFIFGTIAFIIFSNILSIIEINSNYSLEQSNNNNQHLIERITRYATLIQNNRGIYKEEDYEKILIYINDLERRLTSQLKLIKSNYTYKEVVLLYNTQLKDRYDVMISDFDNSVYSMLSKYDNSIIKNIVMYFEYNEIYRTSMYEVEEELKHPYYYGKKVSDSLVTSIKNGQYFDFYKETMLLKDIIKVGEISE